ncbi:histone H1B sperm [Biomphalaria pfeifferi]|uniref:Histone H1B sperm n=1 Tax=Biomphalaria pfeifferi TaxID=112525 RepID=A0AAD8EVV8_BIOPF|nr:histone H1B sperm [Biomphalaria pfeifferi]
MSTKNVTKRHQQTAWLTSCGTTNPPQDVHRKRNNGPENYNSDHHKLYMCQVTAVIYIRPKGAETTITTPSPEQTGQLEKEKAPPKENSADGFVGNLLHAVCCFHRLTST